MKIQLNEIPSEGLSVEEFKDTKGWELDRNDIKFYKPIKVTAFIIKDKSNLSIDLKVDSTVSFTCSRCLKEFKAPLEKSIKLFFQVKGENTLDITDNIREEIILDYPIKVLCTLDCKGICTKCGKDINEGACGCKS